jgi:hypothetical protein
MPKIFKSAHSRKVKEPASEDYCPTDKPPHILCHVLLPKLQSALSLVQILSYNFFLHEVSFATLSKPSSFMRECHALHFVEVSVHMLCFVSIRTNFVKNIKPQYSYLGKFCSDRHNYVNLRHLIEFENVIISAATIWYKWPLHYQLNHTLRLHSLQPFSSSIYNNMLTFIVTDCQLLTFCIRIYAWEMYLDTYIFPFFVTTGGSLVRSVEHFITKETLHKGLSSYLKDCRFYQTQGQQ